MIPNNPVNTLNVEKRIADPVHGLIRLTEIESKVLEHTAFQRLRNISQLGMAKYVYPGAMHNRFSHSLGVLHNVTEIFDVAYRNWVRTPELSGEINADLIFSEDTLQVARLAAMCHDLGHFPFSHNLENSFDWMKEAGLIDDTFRHEQLSVVIIHKLLGHILGGHTHAVADLIEGNYNRFDKNLFSSLVISSAIDADRMDYLVRDALNCGVDQGRYDKERLLDSILPYSVKVNNKQIDVMAFKSKGIEAVEQFLLARHRMHQTIYFNPSVVGFEAGLRRAYFRISSDNPPWDLPDVYIDHPDRFIEFDEAEFFTQLKQELRERDSWLVDPLVNRVPLKKVGPFYHTIVESKKTSKEDIKKYSLLKERQDELEIPSRDWYQQDHWVYVENKEQSLVDSLPRSIINQEDNFEDAKKLKNVIMLVNANGDLIDPTSASYGHTFLPFITGHKYHRFLFFSHKNNSQRIKSELLPLMEYFEDFQSRKPLN